MQGLTYSGTPPPHKCLTSPVNGPSTIIHIKTRVPSLQQKHMQKIRSYILTL